MGDDLSLDKTTYHPFHSSFFYSVKLLLDELVALDLFFLVLMNKLTFQSMFNYPIIQ